mmetsp:Transcript_152060/g.265051  ORF Transcript_152060/g.265051 Transcript_152060/m.265051 type:complete len:1079 (-) Transcript_152060:116-3352(-)
MDFEEYEEKDLLRRVQKSDLTPTKKRAQKLALTPTKSKDKVKIKDVGGESKDVEDDDVHKLSCKIQNCVRCKVSKLVGKWQKVFPTMVPDEDMESLSEVCRLKAKESWFQTIVHEGKYTGICTPCWHSRSSAGVLFTEDTKLCNVQLSLLSHHSRSKNHKAAVQSFLMLDVGPRGKSTAGSPAAEDFASFWDSIQAGSSCRKGAQVCKSEEKATMMLWCLAEAMKRKDLGFIRHAKSICVHRDAACGRLVHKYSAVDQNMHLRQGLLGVQKITTKDYDRSAQGISLATQRAIKEFCTLGVLNRRFHGHHKVTEERDKEAHKTFLKHFEKLNVDSAADEILSSDLMRGRGTTEVAEMHGSFANLKYLGRDISHGLRRLLSRVFPKIPIMKDICDRIVQGKTSIVQIIANSDTFSVWFEEAVAATRLNINGTELNILTKNLTAAKHRYESWSKPFRRTSLFMRCVCKVAQQILEHRRGTAAAQHASDFLEFIDEETWLYLGAMAEAGDEDLMLIREHDSEDMDVSEVSNRLNEFTLRNRKLWIEGECRHVIGFVKSTLDQLTSSFVVYNSGGRSRTIGGITEARKNELMVKVLGTMRQWLYLATQVIEAEIPEFDIYRAFSVFSLAKRGMRTNLADPREARDEIKRLSKAFDVDADVLRAELVMLKPLAQMIFQEKTCSIGEAWEDAYCRTIRSPKYSTVALAPVLYRFRSWIRSTTGVEHVNRDISLKLTARSRASPVFEYNYMKVLQDRRKDEEKEVIGLAREIWAESFGEVRKSGSRLDKGLPRGCRPDSETAFLRARRQSVADLVDPEEDVAPMDAPELTDALQTELAFQREKTRKRKLEAYHDGLLLDHEVDEQLKEDAYMDIKSKEKNAKVRKLAREKALTRLCPREFDLSKLKGHKVIILCRQPEEKKVKACLARYHMSLAEDRTQASIFVVDDVSNPGQRTQWCASLLGAWVLSPKAFLHEEQAVLKYKPYIETYRQVWMSDLFLERHAVIADILRKVTKVENSKWTLLQSRKEFLRIYADASKRGRGSNIVALFAKKEDRGADMPAKVRVLHHEEFLKGITLVDRSQSSTA